MMYNPAEANKAAPISGQPLFLQLTHANARVRNGTSCASFAFVGTVNGAKKRKRRKRSVLRFSANPRIARKGNPQEEILAVGLEVVLVGLNHLLRCVTRTTSCPQIELFEPFFGVFARKKLDF